MEQKIDQLTKSITEAFKGVQLKEGFSWHEADVIDDYGSADERSRAREHDEKNDWTKIPDSIIGDLKLQSVMPFLDTIGLKFYLAPCMIFSLRNYKTSNSIIIHSLIYTLTTKENVLELQKILTVEQKNSIIEFLFLCLEIGEDYFDLSRVEEKMEKYWLHELPK